MRAALREVLPVVIVVLPFGAVYGTVATSRGLTPAEALGLTASVYAGASQLAALQMVGAGAPLWAIILSVFALNFRHVLYSASLGRMLGRFSPIEKALAFFFLVDPVFGAAEARGIDHRLTRTFYFTYAILVYLSWVASSLVGVLFGRLVTDPHAAGLDFILPVYFLTLLMGFRQRGNFLPVVAVSGLAAVAIYLTLGPPWHVTFGGLAGVFYAAFRAPKPLKAETAKAETGKAGG